MRIFRRHSIKRLVLLCQSLGLFLILYVTIDGLALFRKYDRPKKIQIKIPTIEEQTTMILKDSWEKINISHLDSSILSFLSNHTQVPPMLLHGPERYYIFDKADWSENTLLYGVRRQNPGFLTIGIASVARRERGQSYIFITLDSLINSTSEEDREIITVVIFLADVNKTANMHNAKAIEEKYSKLCSTGFIQVIHSPLQIYPNFKTLKRTKHDKVERVVWRSKQNIDYAYLFLYCSSLSSYYIHLEDDVITANGYMDDIRSFLQLQASGNWTCLEFSTLGFIGKLFKSQELSKFATYLLVLYDIQPCDVLLGKYRALQLQLKPLHSAKSLFQHFGRISSLKDKLMPYIDTKFKDIGNIDFASEIPIGDNPPVKIKTNMVAMKNHPPEMAYLVNQTSSQFFWAKEVPRNSFFRLIFQTPQNISRLIIFTGESHSREDMYHEAVVQIATDKSGKTSCETLQDIGKFFNGEFDTYIQGFSIPYNVKCISLSSDKQQKTWILIRKISVILSNKVKE